MTKPSEKAANGGVSVFGLLGVAFVVLKLTGFIDWSWWWVTMPFWGGIALVVVTFLAFAAIVTLAFATTKILEWLASRSPK